MAHIDYDRLRKHHMTKRLQHEIRFQNTSKTERQFVDMLRSQTFQSLAADSSSTAAKNAPKRVKGPKIKTEPEADAVTTRPGGAFPMDGTHVSPTSFPSAQMQMPAGDYQAPLYPNPGLDGFSKDPMAGMPIGAAHAQRVPMVTVDPVPSAGGRGRGKKKSTTAAAPSFPQQAPTVPASVPTGPAALPRTLPPTAGPAALPRAVPQAAPGPRGPIPQNSSLPQQLNLSNVRTVQDLMQQLSSYPELMMSIQAQAHAQQSHTQVQSRGPGQLPQSSAMHNTLLGQRLPGQLPSGQPSQLQPGQLQPGQLQTGQPNPLASSHVNSGLGSFDDMLFGSGPIGSGTLGAGQLGSLGGSNTALSSGLSGPLGGGLGLDSADFPFRRDTGGSMGQYMHDQLRYSDPMRSSGQQLSYGGLPATLSSSMPTSVQSLPSQPMHMRQFSAQGPQTYSIPQQPPSSQQHPPQHFAPQHYTPSSQQSQQLPPAFSQYSHVSQLQMQVSHTSSLGPHTLSNQFTGSYNPPNSSLSSLNPPLGQAIPSMARRLSVGTGLFDDGLELGLGMEAAGHQPPAALSGDLGDLFDPNFLDDFNFPTQ
eukprot:m.33871 g.33871  ORF g.33871 m.33871 type:complete len:588 (+) comp5149_c0_seq1:35-1798(+)